MAVSKLSAIAAASANTAATDHLVGVTAANVDVLFTQAQILGAIPVGSVSAPTIAFSGAATSGFYSRAGARIDVAVSGNCLYEFAGSFFQLASVCGLGWGNGNPDAVGVDTVVSRSSIGAKVVAIGNAVGDASGQIQCASTTGGAGTATFASTNCPAVTVTSVFTWIKITDQSGNQVYLPAWK
jgi:hypothetical protein